MSKPVRISDYLAAQLEEIAVRENRSLANLVQHLLTQALKMDEPALSTRPAEVMQADLAQAPRPVSRTADAGRVESPDVHFKPDFGKKL